MSLTKTLQDYLAARREVYSGGEGFKRARQALLAKDREEVLAAFESLLQDADEEGRCEALAGLAVLYGREATGELLKWIEDSRATVRWVVCGCLHDFGDERAVGPLLKRLKTDADCQVRGQAASTLGQIGAAEALPHLHAAWQADHEVDDLGHTPSSQAVEALTEILRQWVTRQIARSPARTFEETTPAGQIRGTVTAEAIPFDPEGRIHHTPRYAHVPPHAYGFGWSSRLDLVTSLTPPFEIEVSFVAPSCRIDRIFIYSPIADVEGSADCNWAVHTIADPGSFQRS